MTEIKCDEFELSNPVIQKSFNPFRIPVPMWGLNTWNYTETVSSRHCGSNRVKLECSRSVVACVQWCVLLDVHRLPGSVARNGKRGASLPRLVTIHPRIENISITEHN